MDLPPLTLEQQATVLRYRKMARWIVGKRVYRYLAKRGFPVEEADMPDLVGEARLALCEAVAKRIPGRDGFTTYAYKTMWGRVYIRYWKQVYRFNRRWWTQQPPPPFEPTGVSRRKLERLIPDREPRHDLHWTPEEWEIVFRKLPPKMRRAADLTLREGLSLRGAARRMHVSKQYVQQLKIKALYRLRKFYAQGEFSGVEGFPDREDE